MRITASTVQQYTLPLARSVTTNQSLTTLQGIILTLHTNTGLQGYGEISPLPGLHKESMPESTEQLVKCRSHLSQLSVTGDVLSFDGRLSQNLPDDLYPSVRYGIEMAFLDLALQTVPVLSPLPPRLPVNALLIADNNTIAQQIDELLLQGFSCIKMKVARQLLEKNIESVNMVLSQIQGKASLRLDANRGWSLQQACQFCDAVDLQNIEYIEEPTQNPSDHRRLAESFPVSIALDETLAEIACEKLDEKCCHAVVLKPSVLGGFEKTAHIIRWARQHHLTPVISSAFQTSLSTRMYLMFAALNEITQTPLGLDTLKWFREDLLSTPFAIKKGNIPLGPLTNRPKLRQDFLKPLEAEC